MPVALRDDDALRLQVLLTQAPQAVRIDEPAMRVEALTARGAAAVELHPSGRSDEYLRAVRELLSSQVLGSPGGYPVFLRRWTRMGQARDGILERLLLLGEPEAVVAVVHAPGLTEELARRAWWACPSPENARRMLATRRVATSAMAPVLARYLLEYLPFEEEPRAAMDTVRLVLAADGVEPEVHLRLWQGGRHRVACQVGFLAARPETLPATRPPHPDWAALRQRLAPLCDGGDPYARGLGRSLDAPGQAFLHVTEQALQRVGDPDVAVALLDAIGRFFGAAAPWPGGDRPDPAAGLAQVALAAEALCRAPPPELVAVLDAVPALRDPLAAMLTLGCAGERAVAPILARTDAVGSLLRRKLQPVIAPLLARMACLQGAR
ncbi:sulfur reduction protein DsrS [Ectothiorhodospiraceae bacterium 2226]|nr:sulfur reduction protein DsrS [Ectothiorhodospiraceae bacterium 2226]